MTTEERAAIDNSFLPSSTNKCGKKAKKGGKGGKGRGKLKGRKAKKAKKLRAQRDRAKKRAYAKSKTKKENGGQ